MLDLSHFNALKDQQVAVKELISIFFSLYKWGPLPHPSRVKISIEKHIKRINESRKPQQSEPSQKPWFTHVSKNNRKIRSVNPSTVLKVPRITPFQYRRQLGTVTIVTARTKQNKKKRTRCITLRQRDDTEGHQGQIQG